MTASRLIRPCVYSHYLVLTGAQAIKHQGSKLGCSHKNKFHAGQLEF